MQATSSKASSPHFPPKKNTQPFAYHNHSPYITRWLLCLLCLPCKLPALSVSSINNISKYPTSAEQPAESNLPRRSIRFVCFVHVHDSCSSTITITWQTDSTRTCWSADGERGRKRKLAASKDWFMPDLNDFPSHKAHLSKANNFGQTRSFFRHRAICWADRCHHLSFVILYPSFYLNLTSAALYFLLQSSIFFTVITVFSVHAPQTSWLVSFGVFMTGCCECFGKSAILLPVPAAAANGSTYPISPVQCPQCHCPQCHCPVISAVSSMGQPG